MRKQKLGGFSGGMRQRFGIAQALLGNPKLVIVDEPTAGLDPEERVRFHNLLADIAADVVVILSTHIVSDVADLCSNFAIINRGKVLLTGEPATLVAGIREPHLAQGVDQGGSRGAEGNGARSCPRGCKPAARSCAPTARLARRRFRAGRSRSRGCLLLHHRRPSGGAGQGGSLSMQMLAIAWFDFSRRLRMVSTWVYFALYAFIAGLWMAAAGGALARASVSFGGDKILINGPFALALGIAVLGFTGVTVIGSVAGRAVQQDFEYSTYHFFFTAPIAQARLLLRPAAGRVLTLALIFIGIVLGVLIGIHWPGVDPARVVDAPSWQSFVRPYLFLLLPNMLWLGGCFFVLAALTRQMAPVYVAGVIVLVGYLFAVNLLGDMENKTLAALIDPSGATAVDVFTRYWSVAQKNSRQIPIEGVSCSAIARSGSLGVVVTAIGYRVFRMQAVTTRRRGKQAHAVDAELPAIAARRIALPTPTLDRSAARSPACCRG